MRYKLLGASGLRVSELALGTMTFGPEREFGASEEEARRIFDAYAEAGGNFVDTANRYTDGTAERLVGDFVRSDRDHFVVGTKFTLTDRKGDPSFSGNHRKNLLRSLRASLERMKLEHVDVLWLHAWDFTTPPDEVMRTLDDVVRAGQALYVGISDTPAWVVARANTLASLRGWTPFVGVQLEYSLLERSAERELLPMARALDLAVLAWGPLGAGVLTGKYGASGAEAEGRARRSGPVDERRLRIAECVRSLARDVGCTPAQAALAWLRQQRGVVIPVLGARSAPQLRDNLGCLGVHLDAPRLESLDAASRIELGFPHDFLARPYFRDLVYGGTYESLDDHRR